MELVYKKAGHLELIRYKDGKRFLKNGVVNSIATQVTNNVVTLPNGNSAIDMTFSAGKASQAVINLSSFQPTLHAALIAADVSDETGFAVRKIEEGSIPSASPYTVSLIKTPTGDPVIHNEDDSPYAKAASSPAVGQFTVSSNVVTFNSANASEEVIIAYDTSLAAAKRVRLSSEANNDIFRMIVAGEAVLRKDEGTTKLDAITFDKVMPTGEIPWPVRQKEPQGWNVTFQVQPARPGFKDVDYTYEK